MTCPASAFRRCPGGSAFGYRRYHRLRALDGCAGQRAGGACRIRQDSRRVRMGPAACGTAPPRSNRKIRRNMNYVCIRADEAHRLPFGGDTAGRDGSRMAGPARPPGGAMSRPSCFLSSESSLFRPDSIALGKGLGPGALPAGGDGATHGGRNLTDGGYFPYLLGVAGQISTRCGSLTGPESPVRHPSPPPDRAAHAPDR